MTVAIMLIMFMVLILVGCPITFSTGFATLYYILVNHTNIILIAQRMYKSCDSFSLLAIPLFMLAGELMNGGGITKRIVKLAGVLVGHITGSLAHVTILASMMFASMSGSSAAASASIGSMMIPIMEEKGYDGSYAVSVTACAAVMGPIIPPSIAFVVYASISGDSIASLFMGGIVPGIIMGLSLMIMAYVIAKKRHYPVEKRASAPEVIGSLKESIVALLMPIIMMGGIMSGVFTATEAGVIGCVYGAIVGFATKELQVSRLPQIILNAAKTTANILMIMATSQILGWILTTEQLPQKLSNLLLGITTNPTLIFLLILALLLVVGCFMVDAAVMPILAPLLLPIIRSVGIDPIQFGVVANMMIIAGGVTPPVGNLLYIACGIGNVSVSKAVRDVIPFLSALIIAMLLCVFCPALVTTLPNLVLGS